MKKSDGIIKKIGRGLLLGIMTLSFSLPLFACGHKEKNNPVVDPTPPIVDVDPEEKDPQEPVTPPVDDDKQKEEEKKQQAETSLKNFIAQLSQKKNFTYTNGNYIVAIDGNKAKIKNNDQEEFIEETQEGNFNYYTGSDDKIHRKNEEKNSIEQLISGVVNDFNFDNIKWNKVSGNTLQGKKEHVTVTCKLENNELTFTSLNKNFTINKVENTSVEIPVEYIDDNFKVEENIDLLLEKLANPIQYLRIRGGVPISSKIHRLYLKKGESGIVDTLGIVIQKVTSQNNNRLYFGEVVIDGVTKDLTYENICKNGIPNFDVYGVHQLTEKCSALSNEKAKTTYPEAVDLLFDGLFEPDIRDNAEWWGYNLNAGVDADTHTIYLFKDNKIYEKEATVYHRAELGIVNEAVEENFKDKPQSSSTWKLDKNQVYDIPEDSIDVYKIQQQKAEEAEI